MNHDKGSVIMLSTQRAITLVEVLIAVTLMGILAAGSYGAYKAVTGSSSATASKLLLQTARLEARKAVVDGVFPSDPLSITSSAIPVVASPVAEGTVGVLFPEPDTAVFSTISGTDCFVLVEKLGSRPVVGRVENGASSCDPSMLWVFQSQVTGSFQKPSSVVIGGV